LLKQPADGQAWQGREWFRLWKKLTTLVLSSVLLLGMLIPVRAHVTDDVSHTFVHIRRLLGYKVVSRDITVSAGTFRRTTVLCPVGKEVLGGGAAVAHEGPGDFHTVVEESVPGTIDNQYLWFVSIRNEDTSDHQVAIYAICADMKRRFRDIS
jgi:hypothetical protein